MAENLQRAFPGIGAESSRHRRASPLIMARWPALAVGISLFAGAIYILRPASKLPAPDEALIPARLVALGRPVPRAVECRERPIEVVPANDYGHCVSDEQLTLALCAAMPTWTPPPVACLIHELKCWGPRFSFTQDMLGYEHSGEFVLATLLSDELCRKNTISDGKFHDREQAFLMDSPYGIHVAAMGTEDAHGGQAEGHYGQLLKALAQAGVASSTPVTTASAKIGTVADIVHDAVLRFNYDEELEFIACALACWLPPAKSWRNNLGQEFTFDDLVTRLIDAPLGSGPCVGCHAPYAVVVIVRVDERYGLLSARARSRAITWLNRVSLILQQRRASGGGWDRGWSGWPGDEGDPPPLLGQELLDRVTATGHHLEWLALAPADVGLSDDIIADAVGHLSRDVWRALGRHGGLEVHRCVGIFSRGFLGDGCRLL